MRDILKKIYKDKMISSFNNYDFKTFYYFIDENNQVFGISKSMMTDNELNLILSQYELLSEEVGIEEHQGMLDFLFGSTSEKIELKQIKYYMIKFMNVKDEGTYQELNQLLRELFNENIIFIKRHNIYIMIVNNDIDIQFMDVLKSIESDFLIQMIGYVSDLYEVNENLPLYFQFDFYAFQSYKKTNLLILQKVNLIQNNLFNHFDENIKKEIKSYILKEFVHDTEMLNVIKMYFKTNFNSTLAAKNCYMHRNTFINKLDKFISQTHFDIRNSEEAFIVYFALVI